MANTKITYLPGTAPTNNKFTFSCWFRRCNIGTDQVLFEGRQNGSNLSSMKFNTADQFQVYSENSGTTNVLVKPTRKFRDTSAWYHLVVTVDTTINSVGDRVKIYINGVRETSFATATYPAQNYGNWWFGIGPNVTQTVGSDTGSEKFDGLMSHVYYTIGYAYQASTFGSTDSVTGEWKINANATIANYGSTGFFIFKNNNSLTNLTGSGKNFTLGSGALTKTEDCPSNIFCTWNTNYRGTRKDMTLTNGATFIFEQNSGDSSVSGTIAVSGSGKYYWEQRIAQVNGTNAAVAGAMHSTEDWSTTPTEVAGNNNTFGVRSNGNAYKNGTNLGSVTAATYNNDILGIGFDVDNARVFLWRNGVAQNSGNAIITGIDTSKNWIPFGIQHGGARVTTSTNFGNGYFQTTAVSSAGTNASGNGIFEYDVPSGYTAISTKGLNL